MQSIQDEFALVLRDLLIGKMEVVAFMMQSDLIEEVLFDNKQSFVTTSPKGFQAFGYPVKLDGKWKGVIVNALGSEWWVTWDDERFYCVIPETGSNIITPRNDIQFSTAKIQQAKIKFVG